MTMYPITPSYPIHGKQTKRSASGNGRIEEKLILQVRRGTLRLVNFVRKQLAMGLNGSGLTRKSSASNFLGCLSGTCSTCVFVYILLPYLPTCLHWVFDGEPRSVQTF